MSAPMSLSSSYLFSHANTPQDRNIGYLFISIGLASVLLAKLTSNMEDCYLLTCSEKTRKYIVYRSTIYDLRSTIDLRST